jgi:hypothetical protein
MTFLFLGVWMTTEDLYVSFSLFLFAVLCLDVRCLMYLCYQVPPCVTALESLMKALSQTQEPYLDVNKTS